MIYRETRVGGPNCVYGQNNSYRTLFIYQGSWALINKLIYYEQKIYYRCKQTIWGVNSGPLNPTLDTGA
jgi:hypothetical protein